MEGPPGTRNGTYTSCGSEGQVWTRRAAWKKLKTNPQIPRQFINSSLCFCPCLCQCILPRKSDHVTLCSESSDDVHVALSRSPSPHQISQAPHNHTPWPLPLFPPLASGLCKVGSLPEISPGVGVLILHKASLRSPFKMSMLPLPNTSSLSLFYFQLSSLPNLPWKCLHILHTDIYFYICILCMHITYMMLCHAYIRYRCIHMHDVYI